MTDTPFDDEGMLRERFESAVGGLTPDIGRLVADGAAEGRGAVRRRRVVSGIGAAAVAIVAVGSISLASQNDLFGKGDHATNNGLVEQLVPATPRGMTAALLSHTGQLGLGTPLAVGGTKTTPESTTQISGQVAYDLGAGVGVEIDAYATPDLTAARHACDSGALDSATVCRPFTLDDGTPAWYLVYDMGADGDQSAVAAAVLARRDDQVVAVIETMSGSTEFALDQDALAAIVSDPAIGLSTTGSFNALGEQITDYKDGGLIHVESGSGSSGSSGGGSASPPTVATQPATPTSGSASADSGRSH
jgi:hypothetical protein